MINAVPQPLRILTIISLVVAVLAFIFSLLNLGFLSIFLTPIGAVLTIIYQIVIIHKSKSHRDDRGPAPSSSKGSIIALVIIAVIWTGGFTVTIISILRELNEENESHTPFKLKAASLGTAVVESLLDLTQIGVLVVTVLRCFRLKSGAGPAQDARPWNAMGEHA